MASSAAEVSSADGATARPPVDRWTVFAVGWSISVLFHLVGNPRLAPEWGRGLLGVTALFVLISPRRPWASAPLAVAVLVNVWLEAPTLGNHWLLQGLLAVVVLGALVTERARPDDAVDRLVGPARLLLLAFYAFAAFAKLNGDFFDPAVSCAVFYLRESADSWGALGLYEALPDLADRAVAVVVASIELSIPLLLILRRTRRAGVLVAIAFHWVLALDRSHQFADFSSVLTVLFLLFLEPSTLRAGIERVEDWRARLLERWESGPELLRLLGLAAAAAGAIAAAGPDRWNVVVPLRESAVLVFIGVGAAAFGFALTAVRSAPGGSPGPLLPGGIGWLALVPLLAMANGLTPYLEVKSGFGWNMYSNLAVVDGDSNHFVVRSGLPIGEGHERLVRVVESDDPTLGFYLDGTWLLPEQQLEDHVADRPGFTTVGEVDGARRTYIGGETSARPTWQQKLVLHRAVDADGPVNCQPSFGPAR